MIINCSKSLLCEAVNNTQKAVSPKSSIPALEGILLSTDIDKLIVTGYDLELGIESRIEVNVIEEGAVVLNSQKFGEIVRKLPEENVTISSDDKNNTTIKSGLSVFNISGIDAKEYPDVPRVESDKRIVLNQKLLKDMLKQITYAISLSDTRPVLTGALFDIKDGVLKIVGVDGFRLSLTKEILDNTTIQGEYTFIVPHKTLNEIYKILSEDESDIELCVAQKHIMFSFDNVTIISRLLEGDFIDYNKVIPQNSKTIVKLNTREFVNAVDRVSLLISEKIKNPVKCNFEYDTVKVHSKTTMGNGYDEFACEMSGEGLEIGFNGKYLTDALKNCNDEQVIVELLSPLSPIIIKPVEGDSYLYLIVPMRYKADE